jgi:hypothetical protein
MIQVTSIHISGMTLDWLDIRWEIADTIELLSDYPFTVQRSESPAGPFYDVSKTPLINTFTFRDKTVDLKSRDRIYYYRVKVTKTATGDLGYSQVDFLGIRPDNAALEMMRQQQLQLRAQNGAGALIYKRRTSGPHCPRCWDPQLKRDTDSDCTFCFSDKYSGGFHSPIPTFIMFSSSRKLRQVAQVHESNPSSKIIDMTGYPLLQEGDLIVDAINRRYRVENVDWHEKRLFVFRQIVTVNEYPRTDVIYKLPVDATLFPNNKSELFPLPADTGNLQVRMVEPPRG